MSIFQKTFVFCTVAAGGKGLAAQLAFLSGVRRGCKICAQLPVCGQHCFPEVSARVFWADFAACCVNRTHLVCSKMMLENLRCFSANYFFGHKLVIAN